MFSRKLKILSIAILLQLSFSANAGVLPGNTEGGLKELINRIATNENFRNALGIREIALLSEFYEMNQYSLQWFSPAVGTIRRSEFLAIASKPEAYMIDPERFSCADLLQGKKLLTKTDTLYAEVNFTDAALRLLKEISYSSPPIMKYNGWNYVPQCTAVASLLQQAFVTGSFESSIIAAEPENIQYIKIKDAYCKLYNFFQSKDFHEITVKTKTISPANKELLRKLQQLGYLETGDSSVSQVKEALNKLQKSHNIPLQDNINNSCLQVLNKPVKETLKELRWNVRWYRWLSCMQNKSYLSVNIAANRLVLIEYNGEIMSSKIVVGKTSTPSPVLTSVIRNVIYYPYWNVPYSIAVNEMLPKLKRNAAYLDGLNIEVLQGGHAFTSSTMINWHKYSRNNFPFNLRQLPGCNNSLGRLKFDFENPYSVYLHDTNNKLAFLSGKRFYSHGCIRVEEPYQLALCLGFAPEKINMDSCLTGMKPETIPLHSSMPIFIIYATVDVIGGELKWFDDAYHKIDSR